MLYSVVTSVNSVFVSDKIINNSDNFRIKVLFLRKISAILCFFYFLFLFNLRKHVNQSETISFSLLYLINTCDVYNLFISLLPAIVLDNLFAFYW